MALGLSQSVAVLWALAANILVTGALHEDGLADTADGFGGGSTRERKLAIMRDSRIGSYGAIALALSLILRVTALSLATRPAWSLLLAAVFGRAAMLVLLLLLRPARTDGLAAPLARGAPVLAVVGIALSLLLGVLSARALCAATGVALAMSFAARRQIGGYTGDILGATEQIAECAVLTVA
jgi:adenosylcobinamide-GDP ribazoletransferase